MTELTQLSLFDVREGLKKHDFTSTEVVQAHLDAMNDMQSLNAYSAVTAELALQDAAEADRHLSNGTARELEGIPFAVKDLFCTRGVKSTSSSHILDGFEPTYESTVSDNLRQGSGGVMLGKTNMDEFAMGSANITSYDGPVRNPWTPTNAPDAWVVPGGSSGGSAAAVAARLCYGALGSDTGGSIRQPAAFTGTVGIKPTYGRCSRFGMISFASSLDQAGVITRSVQDAAIMLKAICGHDVKDSTSYTGEVPDFEALLNEDISGKVIGIPKEYSMDGTPQEIVDLWNQGRAWLEDAGATTREITLPHTKYALPAYYIVAPAEASSNLARYDGVRYGLRVMEPGDSLDDMYEKTRAAGFGDEVKRRIMIGTYVLSAGYYDAYYRKAQQIRTLIAQDFNTVFEEVDAILAPTTPSAAFKKGEKMDDPVAMFLNDVFTVPSSMAGLPAMSVPAGLNAQGMPLGLQVIGKAFDEAQVLNIGHALERAANFTAQPTMIKSNIANAA